MRSRRKGFTLVELMVSIGIMMLLAGIILSGLNVARKRARISRARRDIAQLTAAWNAYYADHHRFPNRLPGPVISITDSGRACIQILSGSEDFKEKNPRRIPYMDFHRLTAEFNDPWDSLYRIALDENGNGQVTARGETLRMSVAVWSTGPDGISGNADDVLGWRAE